MIGDFDCDKCGFSNYYGLNNEDHKRVTRLDFDNSIQWELFNILYNDLDLNYCKQCILELINTIPDIEKSYRDYLDIEHHMEDQFKKYISILEERDGHPLSSERRKELYDRNMTDLQKSYKEFKIKVGNLIQGEEK